MHKGDVVKVVACVEMTYGMQGIEHQILHMPPGNQSGNLRYLVRIVEKESWTGMVIGYTFRFTGYREAGHAWDWDEMEPSRLTPDKSHKVWLVEPVGKSDRWTEPVTCLEEDLEPIKCK